MELRDIDFVIVGATKSATTTLQHMLQADPAIHMPAPELHYFSREYARGAGWYLAQFGEPPAGALVGEKSNSYLDTPAAAPRLARDLPRARFVAQLRNPIERAYSDYCMLVRRGEIATPLEAALDPGRAADGRFLGGGRYARQIAALLDHVAAERLLVTLYDDLVRDPAAAARAVKAFIGADPAVAAAPVPRVKDRTAPVIAPGLRARLKPLKRLVRPLRGSAPFERARGLFAREMRYPEMSPQLAARLADFYADETAALSKLIGRDLRAWLQPPAPPQAGAAR